MSAHNLIIGTPYIDMSGKSIIKNISSHSDSPSSGEYCELEFFKRGWTSANAFKVEGAVKNVKGETIYKIEGRWNDKVYVVRKLENGEEERELVFEKEKYPEKWEQMYGMTHFGIQHNYFPSWLKNVVAPSDSRRRPD
jgi:hypothetical protein